MEVVPVGEIAYSEACAMVQDWLAARWSAVLTVVPDAQRRADAALARADQFRAVGGTATCRMRV